MAKKKRKRIVVNSANYDSKVHASPEMNGLPSMTIPDEAYSIKDLLRKHASGQMPEVYREGVYDGAEDFDDIDREKYLTLDPVERAEHVNFNKESLREHKRQISLSLQKKKQEAEAAEKEKLSAATQTQDKDTES